MALTLRVVFLASLLASTAALGQARIDIRAEPNVDGLYPVRGTQMDSVWARPDAGLEFYRSILVRPVRISYKPARPARDGQPATFVPEKARMQQASVYFAQQLIKEIEAAGAYEVVYEPQVGTVELQARLADLEAFVSTDPDEGMIPLDSVADMRLVLEMRDGFSGALLIEASVHGEARRAFSGQDDAEAVQALLDHWAHLTAQRLAEIRQTATEFGR